ncbi:rhodanese-like domain-containing protein [bacterium]|nr:rhodanese-like domain-containing protein [bacterium]
MKTEKKIKACELLTKNDIVRSKDHRDILLLKDARPIHMYRPAANQIPPILILIVSLNLFTTQPTQGQANTTELPIEKQTTLGLYVTASEAYENWKQAPDKIKILDVRTPDEYMYIGHASMAWNIPVFIQTYEWDAEKQHFSIKPSPDFIKHIKEVFQTTDTLYVMCRSGGRSAWAVNQLADAGFKNVYNITDGFEGDAISDIENLYYGQRLKNGWKNSGVPWTYKIDRELMKLPMEK